MKDAIKKFKTRLTDAVGLPDGEADTPTLVLAIEIQKHVEALDDEVYIASERKEFNFD